ncbi:MAG: mannitol dehydrogenase family protein [Clostridium sp.]|nr:mannitol dehydrogenase family protein [Clostridium sp.]
MRLTREGIKECADWEKVGIKLPGYDVAEVSAMAQKEPQWVHFGIGNIFRIFIGGIADGLLEDGVIDRGITCVESFDYDVIDKIYDPYDNLGLSVILHGDGTREYKVLGSLAEAVKADSSNEKQWFRLKEIFSAPSLQMVSFTITEKGYALQKTDGSWFDFVRKDIENGPDKAKGAMAVLTAMLYERYKAGGYPLALVSMDNCSQNGARLRKSVLCITAEWKKRGFVDDRFYNYVSNEKIIAFPWTMIDKITPRPSELIAADLEKLGVEDMQPVITGKKTYIAPFVNAEKPQYLVIEDSFPNGRPALEKGFGVYMADRNTVNLSERMKVTVCLNPVHSATGPVGVVLGYDLFAHMLNTNEDMMKMAKMVAYDEGLPVVADPGILSPQAFVDELFEERFPNEYLGDTNLRLAVDVSQMVGIRFGETIKAYVERDGNASALTAIPLGIAGWLRYILAVDDEGKKYELAPDPMNEELSGQLKSIVVGKPETFRDQLKPILSNERLFFIDLYTAGIGEKIENMFREMIAGHGAVRKTIHKYVNRMGGDKDDRGSI